MSRALRATAISAPLFCLATCAEWGGMLSSAWPGDTVRYLQIANATFAGGIPYHSFYDEYPPFALPAFLAPRALSERHYDLIFKLLMIGCWIIAIWAVADVLARLQASPARMTLAMGAMVLAPPLLGQVFLNRYDPYAAMLGVLSLAALVRGHARVAGGTLAAGFEAKVFPAAAAPVAAIRLWRSGGRRRVEEAAAAAIAVGVAISGFFLVVAFGGIGYSYYSQLTRGLQIESMGSSLLLAPTSSISTERTPVPRPRARSISLAECRTRSPTSPSRSRSRRSWRWSGRTGEPRKATSRSSRRTPPRSLPTRSSPRCCPRSTSPGSFRSSRSRARGLPTLFCCLPRCRSRRRRCIGETTGFVRRTGRSGSSLRVTCCSSRSSACSWAALRSRYQNRAGAGPDSSVCRLSGGSPVRRWLTGYR